MSHEAVDFFIGFVEGGARRSQMVKPYEVESIAVLLWQSRSDLPEQMMEFGSRATPDKREILRFA